MKKIITTLLMLSGLAFATDYSSMTTSQLQSLRGTVPATDKPAFQSAMQTKMSTATAAEKAAMSKSKSGGMTGTGLQKGKK